MEYLEYLKIGLGVIFIIVQAWVAYDDWKKKKHNTVIKIAYGIYQFVKKENLLGKIVDNERLLKALELLDKTLYSTEGINLTPDLKVKAEEAFKAWHAEDKNSTLTANTVAVPAKKSKD